MKSGTKKTFSMFAPLGVGISLLAMSIPAQSQLLQLEDTPLYLINNIGPNLVLSMDDSGSMGFAFMPDSLSTSDHRFRFYYRASHVNTMYYDPRINYEIPLDSDGSPMMDAPDFNQAFHGVYYGSNFQYGGASGTGVNLATEFLAPYVHFSFDASGTYSFGSNLANGSLNLIDHQDSNQCHDDLGNMVNTVTTSGPWWNQTVTVNNTLCTAQPAYYFLHYTQFAANEGVDNPSPPANCNASNDADIDCYVKIVIDQPAAGTDGAFDGPGSTNAWGRNAEEEEDNFVNWYQFYSVRADAAKSGLRLSFTPDTVRRSVRVARQTLNNDTTIGSGADSDSVAELDPTERASLYSWIDSVPTRDGTPLRATAVRAGEFFRTTDVYRQDPSNSSSPIVSCRANMHILVTDGLYNGSFNNSSISGTFKHDDRTFTLPNGVTYDPNSTYDFATNDTSTAITDTFPIYVNGTDDTLSDVIFHYWATDLRTDLANNVVPYYANSDRSLEQVDIDFGSGPTTVSVPEFWNPKNDPATWQHMTTYVVSFGKSGDIPQTDSVYAQLLAGEDYVDNNGSTENGWPSVNPSNETGVADDLYHAGINGHGGYYNANNPEALVNVFREITNQIDSRQSVAAPVVANSGRVSTDSLVYLASFDPEKWAGRLRALRISDGSNSAAADDPTDCTTYPIGTVCPGDPAWDAAFVNREDTIDHTNRTVFTYDDTSSAGGAPSGGGLDFLWGGLNPTQQALLSQDQVNYLRGDGSQETDQGGNFRARPKAPLSVSRGVSLSDSGNDPDSRLGAIVHSSPVYVGNGVDTNGLRQFDFPDNLESQSYTAFLNSIASRPAVVYVGANDGMLHAYLAEDTNPSPSVDNGGEELFSFVPNALFDKLPALTDSNFVAQSYVDGPLVVQDAFVGGNWTTLLVGALRTGGQGIFALDVTDPTANAASIVKWEFTDKQDADLGYTFGDPIIARANNGEWVVIVASGYNSTQTDAHVGSGRAALFILNADTGALIRKFSIANPGGVTGPNGLSSPTAISIDGDYNIDYVYAGDLQGNLWKFDISGTNPASWTDASLIYSAGVQSPIMNAPSVGSHPTNLSGPVIYFGTGKYLESTDVTDTVSQGFYGLWDQGACTMTNTASVASTSTAIPCITDANLVHQQIITDTVVNYTTAEGDIRSRRVREVSDNAIDWSVNQGWKFSMAAGSAGLGSEKSDGKPLLNGGAIFFDTVIPDGDICGSGRSGFIYALDRNNGGMTESQVWDVNKDGIIDSNDYGAGIENESPGSLTALTGAGNDIIIRPNIDESSNANLDSDTINNQSKIGRVRWRQMR